MINCLSKYGGEDMITLLQNIKLDIDNFAGNIDQFDDITMMGVKWIKDKDD